MKLPIYMDNHATTQVDPRVLEVMLPTFDRDFGNASSPHHSFGRKADALVENARQSIAKLIGCSNPEDILFTSGATESNNLAIQGMCQVYRDKGNHIITVKTEHSSVLEACEFMERSGFKVTYLNVDHEGLMRLEDLEKAITDKTILISVMTANNEIGVLQPIRQIAEIAKKRNVLFHTDATQAVGYMPFEVEKDGIHLMSLSAHKIYGPKGIGALYVRGHEPRARVAPLTYGGGHERGFRPGTLNVSGIVGFGKAAQIVLENRDEEVKRIGVLRDRLLEGITSQVEDIQINGSMKNRLPNNLNLSFSYVEGESLLKSFEDVALSSSSACTSVNLKVSYVLKALGLDEKLIHASIRYGLGRFNTEEEVDYVIQKTVQAVKNLRELSTLYEIAKKGPADYTLAKLPGEHDEG